MVSSLNYIDAPTKQQAISIAQAALEKKASDVLLLEVGALTSVADYFIFASGESERQVKAIAQHIEQETSSKFGKAPQIEGAGTSTWILLDYGDIVVHIFKTDIRAYYGLERMWSDAPQIPVPGQDESPMALHAQSGKRPTIRIAHYGS